MRVSNRGLNQLGPPRRAAAFGPDPLRPRFRYKINLETVDDPERVKRHEAKDAKAMLRCAQASYNRKDSTRRKPSMPVIKWHDEDEDA